MASLTDIRAGIRAAILSADPEVQCTGYLLENPQPPCFEVELGTTGVVFDLAMQRGLDQWTFIVRGFTGATLDETGQRRMDDWLASSGGKSIKEAIEARDSSYLRSLGGSVGDVQVERIGQIRAYSPVANPTAKFYGVEWTLQVVAEG